jgi:MFS family permease
MSNQITGESLPLQNTKFHYGWVIVSVCALMMAITYGLQYSYGVFFKPLADHFNWSRESVSVIYSASLVIRGIASIAIGWLADRYGVVKLLVFCGFMIGLGLVLSSQVQDFWEFVITYSLIEAIGLSGTFGIVTAVTTRWFVKNRGLALGIVSSGVSVGTLLIVPGNERLINSLGWAHTFIICGVAAGVIMIGSAFFLYPRPRPLVDKYIPKSMMMKKDIPTTELSLKEAIRNQHMIIMILAFSLIFFCNQLVIVHLVNYATDIGIAPLVAATFISIIGIVSIAGRLSMGVGTDKLGIYNTLIACCLLVTVSLVCLIFTHTLWAFYLVAAVFGFAYGGEVSQIPLFVGKLGGTKSMATLVGITIFVANIGGSLGSWLGGKIFDLTSSYRWAFIIGVAMGLGATAMAWVLRKLAQR